MEGNIVKDVNGKIKYKDKEYRLVFNINVMEELQEEYGSIENWGKITDASNGEPNIKALRFGLTAMINEGIDMDNEEKGTDIKPLSPKQVGRMIAEIGMENAALALNKTVTVSTRSAEKNA